MLLPSHQVQANLLQFMRARGGPSTAWYAGIATDPTRRLFSDHAVSKQYGQWAYFPCASDTEARDVETNLVHIHGCRGGEGGGSRSTRWVYVYLRAPYTRP